MKNKENPTIHSV